jgi:hypothetical protein
MPSSSTFSSHLVIISDDARRRERVRAAHRTDIDVLTTAEALARFPHDAHALRAGEYVLHPVVPKRLLPATTANRALAEERLRIWERTALALGAEEVSLVRAEMSRQLRRAHLGLAPFGIPLGMGASTGRGHEEEVRRWIRRSSPAQPGRLDDECELWAAWDPWLAHLRVTAALGCEEMMDIVVVRDQFELDAALAQLLRRIGVSLQVESIGNSHWCFHVRFARAPTQTSMRAVDAGARPSPMPPLACAGAPGDERAPSPLSPRGRGRPRRRGIAYHRFEDIYVRHGLRFRDPGGVKLIHLAA